MITTTIYRAEAKVFQKNDSNSIRRLVELVRGHMSARCDRDQDLPPKKNLLVNANVMPDGRFTIKITFWGNPIERWVKENSN